MIQYNHANRRVNTEYLIKRDGYQITCVSNTFAFRIMRLKYKRNPFFILNVT